MRRRAFLPFTVIFCYQGEPPIIPRKLSQDGEQKQKPLENQTESMSVSKSFIYTTKAHYTKVTQLLKCMHKKKKIFQEGNHMENMLALDMWHLLHLLHKSSKK